MRQIAALAFVLACVSCGGNRGTPTQPTPDPSPPVPSIVSLTGVIAATPGSGRVSGATVRIGDGPNAGRSVTSNNTGEYRFDQLMPGNANVFASAAGFEENGGGVFINGTNTLNLTLTRHLWARTGARNDVFDMPTWVSRVRIYGRWDGRGTSNFAVLVGGRLVVNAILRDRNPYDGVHLVTGGITEIRSSDNIVEWRFTEER